MVGEEGECRVLYDDDMQERLTLPRERFRWLAPRARSAGATPALHVRPSRSAFCAIPIFAGTMGRPAWCAHVRAAWARRAPHLHLPCTVLHWPQYCWISRLMLTRQSGWPECEASSCRV